MNYSTFAICAVRIYTDFILSFVFVIRLTVAQLQYVFEN
jgi:hypothetical protein